MYFKRLLRGGEAGVARVGVLRVGSVWAARGCEIGGVRGGVGVGGGRSVQGARVGGCGAVRRGGRPGQRRAGRAGEKRGQGEGAEALWLRGMGGSQEMQQWRGARPHGEPGVGYEKVG